MALSREWVLNAGHNVDLNDDGLLDPSWIGTFQFPDYGAFSVTEAFTHCSFTGFGNPSVNDDLALLRLANPLPVGLGYPTLGSGAGIGDVITLVGFGRSGNSTNASLTDRRYGSNVIDSFYLDDEGSGAFEIFRYDFDAPGTTGQIAGSLGNDVETIIGPGGSGGAPLTDMMSMSMQAYWNTGGTNARIFGVSQGRTNKPFWRDADNFIRSSPIHGMDDLDTPLLVAFGDKDGAVDFG